ncbi:MAG: hypothetical protein RLW62_09750 [Gammaproteobacteria bacterium]
MRTVICRILTGSVLVAVAQGSVAQAPSEAEMRRLMEQARQMQENMQMPDAARLEQLQAQAAQMQACMEKVDQTALEAMRRDGEALGEELRALCAAGKRDDAQARAFAYGKRVAASPVMAEMASCGEMMRGMLPALDDMIAAGEAAGESSHVCDEMTSP